MGRMRTAVEYLPATAGCLQERDAKGCDSDTKPGHLIPILRGGIFDDVAHTLKGEGFDASEDGTGRGTPLVPIHSIQAGALRENPNSGPDGVGVQANIAYTLEARAEVQAVAFDTTQITSKVNRCRPQIGDPCHPLAAGAHPPAIAFNARQDPDSWVERTGPLDTDGTTQAIAFSCKDHGADAGDISPTLRSMGHDGSHANGGGQVAVLTGCSEPDTYIGNARSAEADAVEALSSLRREIGEEAFSEWGLGILASFLPEEILQSAVHGAGLRCPTIQEFGLVNYALAREEDRSERFVREMRSAERGGRASFGWGPHEQRSRELAAYLSKLSQPGASAEQILRDLREASEGAGVLRHALPAIQEVGRPTSSEGQPVLGAAEGDGKQSKTSLLSRSVWAAVSREWFLRKTRDAGTAGAGAAVRRLVPVECEFLQGFPRNYTAIPGAKDGPRYKALGNSMAVPVMAWIGRRIALVDALPS